MTPEYKPEHEAPQAETADFDLVPDDCCDVCGSPLDVDPLENLPMLFDDRMGGYIVLDVDGDSPRVGAIREALGNVLRMMVQE